MLKTTIYVISLCSTVLISCGGSQDSTTTNLARNYQIPDSVMIPVEHAQKMVENYAPRAGTVDHGGQLLPNTRSIWLDIDLLEAIVDQTRLDGGNGIRFYLAAYDPHYSGTESWMPPAEYWAYTTLLLVPTSNTDTSENLEVLPSDRPVYNHGSLTPPRR